MATKRTLIGNIKGPKGDTGAQGPQGATGPGATIEVGTVSTTAYGNTAQVTNSGTATAAVLDFVIPQGKPGEQTTKMSGLTLDTVTASTADYPIPATGDTGSVAWGKVIKFFNDAKTAIASKINISDIVNNLTSTATNKPLSAAQGKALNDALATTNSNVSGVSGRVTSLESKSQQSTVVGPGGSSVSVTVSSMYTIGNLVAIQARLHVNSAINSATGFPLFNIPSSIAPYLPVSSRIPGFISFHNNGTTEGTYVGLCEIRAAGESNPTKYVYQSLTGNIAAGADVDVLIFFAKA